MGLIMIIYMWSLLGLSHYYKDRSGGHRLKSSFSLQYLYIVKLSADENKVIKSSIQMSQPEKQSVEPLLVL